MRDINITGVVLAGGMSRRLGRNKALEIFNGQPMITGIVEKIRKITSNIVVVVNDVERAGLLPISEDVNIVTDVFPDKGSLGGIYTGLTYASTEWIMVVACDMPFINLELMEHMISKIFNHDVVIPVRDGRPETMHALYSKKCVETIETNISMDDLKITNFFQNVRVRFVEDDELKEFDSTGISFFNVNTESELAEARQVLKQRSIERTSEIEKDHVKISVETFGMARKIAGTSGFDLHVKNSISLEEFCTVIANMCPTLLQGVIRKDYLGLEESYVFNLNGESFLNCENLNFHDGDNILLFSSQAGG